MTARTCVWRENAKNSCARAYPGKEGPVHTRELSDGVMYEWEGGWHSGGGVCSLNNKG